MTQPTLPLATTLPLAAGRAASRSNAGPAARRRGSRFALDERTKAIGLAGVARARAALAQAAREAGGEQQAA